MKEAKAINSIIVAHCEDEGELEKGACINLGRVSKENGLVGINNAQNIIMLYVIYNYLKKLVIVIIFVIFLLKKLWQD